MPNAFLGIKKGNDLFLDEDETAHLKVIRKSEGEVIDVFTGDGFIYKSKIEKISKKTKLKVIESIENKKEFQPKINLYLGASKWDKMQIMIEKSVELRVNNIFIFNGDKSNLKYTEDKKIRKTIIESSKQSYQPLFPNFEFVKFENIPKDKSIVLDFSEDYTFREEIKKIDSEVNIIFGPDMGFSEREKKFFTDNNFKIISLGNTIMRLETAIIYVMSAVNYEHDRLIK